MLKNSSNSSVGSLDFSSYNLTKKEFSTSDIRMEELHEILIREEYRKYAIDNQIIEATDEFDENAFTKVGLLISKNEETYNEISRRVLESILEIVKIEEFTEEELQELECSQAVQKFEDEIDIQKSNESAIQKPFTNPTPDNLERFNSNTGRGRYCDEDGDKFLTEIRTEVATNKSDEGALFRIFARFLSEFNDDLHNDDFDVCDPESYAILLKHLQDFIVEVSDTVEPDIRQQVFTNALKLIGDNIYNQELFLELIPDPMTRIVRGGQLDKMYSTESSTAIPGVEVKTAESKPLQTKEIWLKFGS